MLIELIGSYFGKELMGESAKSLYGNIAGIISYHLPEVQEILKDIDIANDINIIKNLILEVKDVHNKSNSFATALNAVDIILENINSEIKNIEREIINHKQKWFYSWRTPNYSANLTNLKKLKITLNTRLDYFVKITQVLNNLHMNCTSNTSNTSNTIYNDVTDVDIVGNNDNLNIKTLNRNNSYGTFKNINESEGRIETQVRPNSH